ncbi:aminoglycoside adenylyltransferase domain-containing protein [Bradyrhizobium sp. SYSU BS000235]|uniref:aminoglycoside adenylyltransferase domain-containing protein n=1 Tax=Bradyrhizobium sp. SYSU BS000235 TaxID=3411332 RepID=UPI003C78411E
MPAASLRDALPALLGGLHGDERNVLLTLARMWHTPITGKFIAKDAAATRAIPHLPAPMKEVLAYARENYLGRAKDKRENRLLDGRQTASHLHQQVIALLIRYEEPHLSST